ncbi:hypothetical protein J25TS5_31720 [Paenibacillus faecis]|nr:hypothetical protein J25TS5_31720 [Paenibacillus faecis]
MGSRTITVPEAVIIREAVELKLDSLDIGFQNRYVLNNHRIAKVRVCLFI